MRKWQAARKFRFRTDLLYHWAKLLEKQGKLKITVIDTKIVGRNILTPLCKPPVTVLPSYFSTRETEDGQTDEGINTDDEDSGEPMSNEEDPDSIKSKKEKKDEDEELEQKSPASGNNKRKRKISNANIPSAKKQKKAIDEKGAVGGVNGKKSSMEPKLFRDKERFYQATTDMINGIKECDQVLDSFWLRAQEDDQTITRLRKKIASFIAKREEDQTLITALREENAQLRVKLFQMKKEQSNEAEKPTEQSNDKQNEHNEEESQHISLSQSQSDTC
eukprot:TRINITY_DN1573_c0_g1_i2.p1 TRINITY_DN1573_c0_g1~~TRINITY_DN1573_c0_g1_i2.p1  ORF type:complete len:276 (-),score=71.37 TRINITY_DN1573_c0_g1_i2:31-858(-)